MERVKNTGCTEPSLNAEDHYPCFKYEKREAVLPLLILFD